MARTWTETLEVLMHDRGAALFGYAYMLTGTRHDAEDLVQSALVKSFGRPLSAPHLAAAEGYVRRAIFTLFLDDRKRAWRQHEVGIGVETAEPRRGDADARMTLLASLATLPPRQRACVVLRFYEGYSSTDIARELGLADATVRGYISDGLASLECRLGSLGLTKDDVFGSAEHVAVHTR